MTCLGRVERKTGLASDWFGERLPKKSRKITPTHPQRKLPNQPTNRPVASDPSKPHISPLQGAPGGFGPTALQGVQRAFVEDHVEVLRLQGRRQVAGVLGEPGRAGATNERHARRG